MFSLDMNTHKQQDTHSSFTHSSYLSSFPRKTNDHNINAKEILDKYNHNMSNLFRQLQKEKNQERTTKTNS